MARMLYLVIDDKGYNVSIFKTELHAKSFIALYGNENYKIESEVC
jgi:hypothetical protein